MRLKSAIFCVLILFCLQTVISAQSDERREFKLPPVEAFILKWKTSGGSELGSSQLFVAELCDLIGVPRPDAPQQLLNNNVYGFEKQVTLEGGTGRIDFYLKGKLLWESKQGSYKQPKSDGDIRKGTAVRDTKTWDSVMVKAREQAENYIVNLPKEEGRPPFLIVVDIGYVIDIYADFTGNGYTPFPSARENRIYMDDFRKPEVLTLFRTIWTDPLSLDPSREREKVTNEIAEKLSGLAKSLEESGYGTEEVTNFLMKAVFTMYAEDCQLIPYGTFTKLLNDNPDKAFIEKLFANEALRLHGGHFFKNSTALNLNKEQITLLLEAAQANWAAVDTSIFGTLLQRALTTEERFKLGAYYTPTAYVERLIVPTIMESLREKWNEAIDAALEYVYQGDIDNATATVVGFHRHLIEVVILDPASGSGNFLSVSLRMVKDLEGEVVQALRDLGQTENDFRKRALSVSSSQFRGVEANPLAASVSELVLKIAYLQQHYRIHGNIPPLNPVNPDFMSVECRDAVLAWDGIDSKGKYINPRPADPWPKADYIVGNPPFIGGHRMRSALGDGYVDALHRAYSLIPKNVDYVMYWWDRSAQMVVNGTVERFGLITTNNINQRNIRKVVENYLNQSLTFVMAIPDHPWYSADSAQVRIAMTVGAKCSSAGRLRTLIFENKGETYFNDNYGHINAHLRIGVDITKAVKLSANKGLASEGIEYNGDGFLVKSMEEATSLGYGKINGLEQHLRPFLNGKDLAGKSRNYMIIDLYGLTELEVQKRYPVIFERLLKTVKPSRDTNNDPSRQESWWLFGRPKPQMREAFEGLDRYIATVKTSRRRYFVFLDTTIVPDSKLITFASNDAYILGILSSRVHIEWVLATGNRQGVGNDPVYVKGITFDTFPFPETTEKQKELIRSIAEKIDQYRKLKQQEYPDLTLTDMYAVIEQITYGVQLTAKEQAVSDKAELHTLISLHNELDKAVFAAYGWSDKLTDEEILQKLFDLNQQRAKEEASGTIRYLRPEFQSSQK